MNEASKPKAPATDWELQAEARQHDSENDEARLNDEARTKHNRALAAARLAEQTRAEPEPILDNPTLF